MRVRRSKAVQFFSGDEEIFNHVEEKGPMWEADGARKVFQRVDFPKPFDTTPIVNAGLSLIDASKDSNLRIWVRVTEIELTGFTIAILTWDDTRLAQACVSWTAIGEA
jgi:hypothetical protein